MKGKVHSTSGLIIGTSTSVIATLSGMPVGISIGSFAACAIASIIPDIDSFTSQVGKKHWFASRVINKMFGHRGFVHTPLCLAFISAIIYFILNKFNLSAFYPILYGFIFGYFSHLFLDTMTKGGIMWLYPFYRKKLSLTNMKSGSGLEWIMMIAYCVIFSFVYYKYNYLLM